MAADPSVSIIIPAYNAAAFVGDAIASALAQTQPGVEVIVVDDGSADATWERVLAWAEADPRVVALRQPRQSGPSAARNAALDVARGRWVALLDADDLFAPDRLARMIRHAEETGADLLADDLLKCDFVTGTALGPCFGAQMKAWAGPLSLLDLVRGDMPDLRQGQHAKLGFLQPIMRREFLEQHRIRYAEDVTTRRGFPLLLRMRRARRALPAAAGALVCLSAAGRIRLEWRGRAAACQPRQSPDAGHSPHGG